MGRVQLKGIPVCMRSTCTNSHNGVATLGLKGSIAKCPVFSFNRIRVRASNLLLTFSLVQSIRGCPPGWVESLWPTMLPLSDVRVTYTRRRKACVCVCDNSKQDAGAKEIEMGRSSVIDIVAVRVWRHKPSLKYHSGCDRNTLLLA